MQQYEQYKDSGVAWLGEVPSHWEIKRLKFSIANISNKIESQMSRLRYFGLENIQSFTGNLLTDIELESEGIANEFQKYDVLFGKLRPYLAKVHLAKQNGLVSTEALVFRSNTGIKPEFLFYFCMSADFIDAVNSTTFGSKMPRASWEDISNFKMLIPPLPEQTAIATYLDSKLSEIDTLISKQETLLEKLAEQRTAIITHTVTKGLNPDVEMKNSGVEWLGEVPSHWEVLSIKRLSQVKRGASPRPIDNPDYFDDNGEYAWVRIADVTASNTYLFDTTQKLSDLGKMFSVPLEPDSLFLSIAGSVGKPIITKIKACIHDGFVYFPEYKNNIKFLYYIFLSGQPYLGLGKMGTQLNLNTDTVGSIKIGLPPLHEQTAIADYLDEQTAQIDRLSERVQQVIDSLKSYRSALITQAVTGKIKVI